MWLDRGSCGWIGDFGGNSGVRGKGVRGRWKPSETRCKYPYLTLINEMIPDNLWCWQKQVTR